MRALGELEASIMDVVWREPEPVTVRAVFEELRTHRRLAYTTVMTVMDNLYQKGVLARELSGRAYHYRATHTREEYSARFIAEALDSSRDRPAALFRFIESMAPDEVARLRKLLDEGLEQDPHSDR